MFTIYDEYYNGKSDFEVEMFLIDVLDEVGKKEGVIRDSDYVTSIKISFDDLRKAGSGIVKGVFFTNSNLGFNSFIIIKNGYGNSNISLIDKVSCYSDKKKVGKKDLIWVIESYNDGKWNRTDLCFLTRREARKAVRYSSNCRVVRYEKKETK